MKFNQINNWFVTELYYIYKFKIDLPEKKDSAKKNDLNRSDK